MEGAIFDLDGTLLDTMEIWDSLGLKYLQSNNIKTDDNLKEILKPMSLYQAAQYFINEHDIKYSAEDIVKQISLMIENDYKYNVQLKPGVLPFLEKLKDSHTEMCIVTATERHLAEAALKRHGILNYFSFIITCGEFGSGKDKPDIFEDALVKLEKPKNETVVFEDAFHAVKTAKEAGFFVVGVYDTSLGNDEEKIKSIADRFIYSFNDCEVDML